MYSYVLYKLSIKNQFKYLFWLKYKLLSFAMELSLMPVEWNKVHVKISLTT